MPKITILADLLGTDHIQKFYRHPEFDVFILTGQGEDLDRLDGPQRIDQVPNHDLRRRGTSPNANNLDVMQPPPLYFTAICDQVAGNAGFDPNFAQPIRIRTILSSDHENHVDKPG